ncbi:uncharacterized protein GGS22DRAFT_179510 [Annulohypoxylon maeteangense]|uniref:uncharacterized protein n=1 Tax=Annulohypoxylon maeteangense TaxID=1927788 RepID=UPI0020077BFA|nr:uncharacterized protein GGS22DRAFT_179510 [Annulohypoxylon maeteangense]KAI0885815.1 hypothetical protein GGS22DRAFT_179510 [Annulohypoxylon maeteangense]
MPKSLGSIASHRTCDPSAVNTVHLTSHSDPSIPLVSVFSPFIWSRTDPPYDQRQHPPRPRPSLQVYYTAPEAGDPAYLELAARTLETEILNERHQGKDPDELADLIHACIEHQQCEIAARSQDKGWYIQRYDVGGSQWRRALWVGQDEKERRDVGLSIVFFDLVNREESDEPEPRPIYLDHRAESVEMEDVLIRELKAELNWQHSASQFEE